MSDNAKRMAVSFVSRLVQYNDEDDPIIVLSNHSKQTFFLTWQRNGLYGTPTKCLENNFENQEPVNYIADLKNLRMEILEGLYRFLGNIPPLPSIRRMLWYKSISSALVPSGKCLRSYFSFSLLRTKPKIKVEYIRSRSATEIRITGQDVSLSTYMKYKGIKAPPPSNKKEAYFKGIMILFLFGFLDTQTLKIRVPSPQQELRSTQKYSKVLRNIQKYQKGFFVSQPGQLNQSIDV
ncbi:hypothetical protein BDC45DRAFT_537590 [Circinella umbellata]|nr:hypothetical protein BDC45DRAFT_537590 [Circinella umbellata]